MTTETRDARPINRMDRGETRYTAEFRTEIGHTFDRHWPTLREAREGIKNLTLFWDGLPGHHPVRYTLTKVTLVEAARRDVHPDGEGFWWRGDYDNA